jgi:hypothetical protein
MIYVYVCVCIQYIAFEVLLLVTMQITVFHDVPLCRLVDTNRRFRGTYCLHLQVPPEADFAVIYCFMHYYVALN